MRLRTEARADVTARLEERFDEYSSLPSVEAAARDDDDDAAEFGQRHTNATFKVSKRIMSEIKTSNQFRQPKQVEATVTVARDGGGGGGSSRRRRRRASA